MRHRRVQVFDTLFNYSGSIIAGFPASGNSPAVMNARIYIPGNVTDSSLVKVYSAQVPFNFLYSFVSRVVPIDQPAIAMNALRLAANEKGEFCYAFTGLPFIFIYNSQEKRIGSIELHGNLADRILKANLRSTGKVTQFFSGLHLLNNGTIIMASSSEVNFLEPEDGKYRLRHKFYLAFDKTSSKKEGEKVPIYGFFYDHGLLYIYPGIAGSYVLCYKIPIQSYN
jgi:hypothetical protein